MLAKFWNIYRCVHYSFEFAVDIQFTAASLNSRSIPSTQIQLCRRFVFNSLARSNGISVYLPDLEQNLQN